MERKIPGAYAQGLLEKRALECLVPLQACFALEAVMFLILFTVEIWVENIEGGFQVYQIIGESYYDLAFIEHSDLYAECTCPFAADIYDTCGYYFMGNVSLCEEKQFQQEVLTSQWAWYGPRYRNVQFYNITNPDQVAGGTAPTVQELDVVSLVDSRVLGSVDRAALDETGILTFSTGVTWMLDKIRRRGWSGDLLISPHYVFATMLHNGMTVPNMADITGVYPAYFPLLQTAYVSTVLNQAAASSPDYMTAAYSDGTISLVYDSREAMTNSYYSAEKLGLQGLSFFSAVQDGAVTHCGYDRDCVTQPPAGKLSINSPSCDESTTCIPNTLKYSAHGLDFGVSSLRCIPGVSYYDIEQVASGGENAVWDYTKFSAVGTTWPSLEQTYFLLFDITLDGIDRFLGIQVVRWKLAKYHERRENCGAGGGGDSAGIDCPNPAGLISVGPGLDGTFPAPVYLSSGLPGPMTGDKDVSVLACGSIECKTEKSPAFEALFHEFLGFRVGYFHPKVLSIRLIPNAGSFTNSGAVVPYVLTKDYFYLGQFKMAVAVMLDYLLSFHYWDILIFHTIHCCAYIMPSMLWPCYLFAKSSSIDVENDKCCA